MLTSGHQKHIMATKRYMNTAVRRTVSPARAGQAAPTPAAVPGQRASAVSGRRGRDEGWGRSLGRIQPQMHSGSSW